MEIVWWKVVEDIFGWGLSGGVIWFVRVSGIEVLVLEDLLIEVVMVNVGGWGVIDDGGGMVVFDVEMDGVGVEEGVVEGVLMMRWIVVLDFNVYFFKSLVFVRVLFFSKRCWVFGVGVEVDDLEMMVLRLEIVFVSWVVMGMVRDGLSDLMVREMMVFLYVVRIGDWSMWN